MQTQHQIYAEHRAAWANARTRSVSDERQDTVLYLRRLANKRLEPEVYKALRDAAQDLENGKHEGEADR